MPSWPTKMGVQERDDKLGGEYSDFFNALPCETHKVDEILEVSSRKSLRAVSHQIRLVTKHDKRRQSGLSAICAKATKAFP